VAATLPDERREEAVDESNCHEEHFEAMLFGVAEVDRAVRPASGPAAGMNPGSRVVSTGQPPAASLRDTDMKQERSTAAGVCATVPATTTRRAGTDVRSVTRHPPIHQ
jgi:hypothetical protein